MNKQDFMLIGLFAFLLFGECVIEVVASWII